MFRLEAYDTQYGTHLNTRPIPVVSCSWSQSWNTAGSMSVTIAVGEATQGIDLNELLVEQYTLLALMDGDQIIHAGPILEAPEWDAESQQLTIKCGGGWSLLDWRLVLDPRLNERSYEGSIEVDEDNPSGEWVLGYGGSAGDIAKALIGLAQQWGRLCVNVPVGLTEQPGIEPLSVSAYAWEMKTIGSMLDDLMSMETAGQLRFDPKLDADGRFSWQTRWARTGIVDHSYLWNTLQPDSRIVLQGVSGGGTPIATQVWATGGRSDGRILITRADDESSASGMLLQAGNASNTNSLAALHAYARGTLAASRRDRTWKLRVGREHQVRVGDHIDLRVQDEYVYERNRDGQHTSTLIALVVTDVSGNISDDYLDVQARQRATSVNGVRPGNSNPMTWLASRLDRLQSDVAAALTPVVVRRPTVARMTTTRLTAEET
ncbi:hypothetical protein D2E25_0240 [Bifidobacterium goeldii]|uniref:Uncharacterized protein n=1 Tax=Bifidobacterium goeldii TaxID=2306975 RepID=A0A430FM08_9BIFI|nr:hypothetical protein [Bifidobacterium goeldii]RSX53934.1 hypothetical protein D2E25_0240 [Bifidobacterium goeldii]